MEALATHACGAANSKYHCGRMAGEVTRTIRLNAPVSDRQTGARDGIYRVASKVANRRETTVARAMQCELRESPVTI
ncbi:hypothetical protein D3C72_2093090 [compost metagenome]